MTSGCDTGKGIMTLRWCWEGAGLSCATRTEGRVLPLLVVVGEVGGSTADLDIWRSGEEGMWCGVVERKWAGSESLSGAPGGWG
jgi:hypothetical protein